MNQQRTRSISLGVLLAGVAGALFIGTVAVQAAAADTVAGAFEIILVSDDIRKGVTATMRPGDDAGGDEGNGNNGHGNNEDGVDSSNPGQGAGGPNGATDPSGDVDDEAGGGGAAPSKNK